MLKLNVIVISFLFSFGCFAMNLPSPEVRVQKIVNNSSTYAKIVPHYFRPLILGANQTWTDNPYVITDKRPLNISLANGQRKYKIIVDLHKSEIQVIDERDPSKSIDHLPLSNLKTIDIYIDPANRIHLFIAQKEY